MTSFSKEALDQPIHATGGSITTVENIIKAYEGQVLIIEVWASWCPDCIKSLFKVKKFQEKYPEVKFVFFSVDDDEDKWKTGLVKYIDKFEIEGMQYHFKTGWDNTGDNIFIDEVGLDWIPRYILIGRDGQILVDYAKSIDDKNILENL
ncbi:redoxin family protein [Flavobacteriaceae bacterium Ap0902]|nr:redoxin family protein [Flavobacteriaceae bacterium Ap0902]